MPEPKLQPAMPGPRKPKAMDYAAVNDWAGYYHAVLGKPPRETLVAALEAFDRDGPAPAEPRVAIDLACGEGRDTLELLRRGWRVLATEAEPTAFDLLLPRVPPGHEPRLETSVSPFQSTPWRMAHLINASFALPFCPREHFMPTWRNLVAHLLPGGRFAGQFFGDRDTWTTARHTLGFSESSVRGLFADLEIESFTVEERDDATVLGDPKHWHVFHILARRTAAPAAHIPTPQELVP